VYYAVNIVDAKKCQQLVTEFKMAFSIILVFGIPFVCDIWGTLQIPNTLDKRILSLFFLFSVYDLHKSLESFITECNVLMHSMIRKL